ncbi:MAG: AAA domain-containing protein [bacterium]|nr:AAA domain-containing protein [bacterium]
MQLTAGQTVNLAGTIQDRQVRDRRDGSAMARAKLIVEGDDDHVHVVWWQASSAPPDGSRVRIKGRIREFKGTAQLHADETSVDWSSSGEEGSLSCIAAFYRACVEAEAAMKLHLRPDGKAHIVLDDTVSPMHETLSFTKASPHWEWLQDYRKASGQALLAGWPLVIGKSPGRRDPVLSPLLLVQAELELWDDIWKLLTPGTGVDLNPFALDLLGLDEEVCSVLVAEVRASVEVEESETLARHAHAILKVLESQGVEGLEDLDPAALSPTPTGKGIHNAGVVMTASADTRIIGRLIGDLEEVANYPELLSSGPAAVLLGQTPAAHAPLPEPHPTIDLSSLSQDRAIHSAMVNELTVVTGPPGTGKSQVLVNVVAAAVARGETVLFASKNNQAVNVVVDRLRSSSSNAIVIRAGSAKERGKMAESIKGVLSSRLRDVDSVGARDAWKTVERSLHELYRSLGERHALETELSACESALTAILDRLPPDVSGEVDLQQLDTALADTCRALESFGDRLWWFGRKRRHRRRLAHAREALHRIGDILGKRREEVEACLSAVDERPVRTLAPRRAFRSIEEVARDLLDSVEPRRRRHEIRTRLSELPCEFQLEDRLFELGRARLEAGRRLLDARWHEVRHESPEARKATLQLSSSIERMADLSGDGQNEAFQAIPSALPALPVWAVSNMSARTNLPLKPGLFDLVVIDEASQCDIASALPLLVRGKRALIIGDPQQLIHITSLGRGRERSIARQSGLTDAQTIEFSYTDKSCFALASSRVPLDPLMLDLHFRSHPAIIDFSNRRFYDDALKLCSDSVAPEGMRAVQWVSVSGRSTRGADGRSRLNEAEAQQVVRTVVDDLAACRNGLSIGIVTPYVAQVRRIKELLEKKLAPDGHGNLLVATAHKFQGDERDVMYFSPVIDRTLSASEVRFAANANLVNVAVTRACRRLVIVGDPVACRAHDNTLRALADYILPLQESGFQSPLERDLCNALRNEGVAAQADATVGGYRLGLAIEHNGIRLDIECDGAPFRADTKRNAERDQAVEAAGWSVMRFSARTLKHEPQACLRAILKRIVSH